MAKVAWRSLGIRFMLGFALTWASKFIVEVTAEKLDPSVAILLAAKDGPAGDLALQEWSTYLRHSDVQAAVWVVCLANTGRGNLVDNLSNLAQFPVNEDQSWSTAMRSFSLIVRLKYFDITLRNPIVRNIQLLTIYLALNHR